MRPVELVNVKVLDVQVQLLFAQLAGSDGFQGRSCRGTRVQQDLGRRKNTDHHTEAHLTEEEKKKGTGQRHIERRKESGSEMKGRKDGREIKKRKERKSTENQSAGGHGEKYL